jgi:hypothetical protein
MTNRQGQATGYCYMYTAALYCEACGEAIRERLTAEGKAPADPNREHTYDSDDFPKGPTETGEADCPHHCDGCGVFLENDLTDYGQDYAYAAVHTAWRTWDLEGVAIKEWAPFYGIAAPAFIGVDAPLSYERRIELANAPQDGDDGQCFVFEFGAVGTTYVAAWGHGIEDCLENAAQWLADHAPGHLTDLADEYREYNLEARYQGATEEQAEEYAREQAEVDMSYTERGWLNSAEWTYTLENPAQADMQKFLGVESSKAV